MCVRVRVCLFQAYQVTVPKKHQKREGVVSATCGTTCRLRPEGMEPAKLHANHKVLCSWKCVSRLQAYQATVPKKPQKREGVVSATCHALCRMRLEMIELAKLCANRNVSRNWKHVRRLKACLANVPKKTQKREGVVSATCRTPCRRRCE